MLRAFTTSALLISLVMAAPGEDMTDRTVADIGSAKQFWFNAQPLIADSALVRIVQQQPTKHRDNPLVVADKPWEGTLVELYTADVQYDPKSGQWQCWYDAHPGEVILCTAFSKDGLHWTKPSLGLQEWGGNKNNNIVLQSGTLDGNGATVVKAPTEKDPAKRYKLYHFVAPQWFEGQIPYTGYKPGDPGLAAAREKIKPFKGNGWYVAYSSDGVDFKTQPAEPVLKTMDSATFFWDTLSGKYRSYHKIAYKKPEWAQERRCMWFSDSDDGIHFSPSKISLVPDETDDAWAKSVGGNRVEFYGMHAWPVENFYLGIVWVFLVTHADSRAGYDDGHILPYLIYSADGIEWNRLPVREPFIPAGAAGTFECGSIYTTGDYPVTIGDEVRFYYFGCAYTHGHTEPFNSPGTYTGFGLATLPRDRYVGWHAATVPGAITTKPLRFKGKELRLNLDATRGQTRVELLDAAGKPIKGYALEDCDPITVDSFDQVVKWRGKGDLSALAGKPLQVRISLQQSVLYTWQFK